MDRAKWVVVSGILAMVLGAKPASASLIYDASIIISGSGFGAIPRMLTMQEPNDPGTESGCVGVSGGAFVIGSAGCLATDAAFDGNTVLNVGGNEPNPHNLDGNKYATPSLASMGITTAGQIGIVFNATDPACGSADLTDLTLKFYSGTANVGSIDGQQAFSSTDCGNGSAGFVFRVSPTELAYVNGLITTYGTGMLLALEATAINATNGPDSFFAVNLTAPPPSAVPEPTSLLLLGTGLFGTASAAARRRKAASKKQ